MEEVQLYSLSCPQLERIELDMGFASAYFKCEAVMIPNGFWMQQFRQVTQAELDEFKVQRRECDRRDNVAATCCTLM
jgi:hypothetical protein